MSIAENPYAAPAAESFAATLPAADLTDPAETRRRYLRHEAAVRSIGALYYVGAAIMGFAGVVQLVEEGAAGGEALALGLVCCALALVGLLAGRDLRRLNPRIKSLVVLFAVLGLLSIPIGTVINAYILYLILSKKGAMVFSEDYKEVIRLTPHIKRRSGLLLWLLGGLLLIVLLIVFL